MIDLVMFAFLVAGEFAVGAVTKVGGHDLDVADLGLRVLDLAAEVKPVQVHPLIQTPVDWQMTIVTSINQQ